MKKDAEIIAEWCNSCQMKDGKYECYGDEELTTCFWALNVTGNMHMFDFDKNFSVARDMIERKLSEHGLMGSEKYAEVMEEMMPSSDPRLEDFTIKNDWMTIDADELKGILFEHITGRLKEEWAGREEFEDMQEVLEKLEHSGNLTQSEKTLLFDKVIHLEHVTGSLLDIDIEELRNNFEKSLNGESVRKRESDVHNFAEKKKKIMQKYTLI